MRPEEEARGRADGTKERVPETSESRSGKNTGRLGYSCSAVGECAAKAFYSCPAIISQRLESQKIPKEPQLNTEEESKIIQARLHITLEKSSRNYKPFDE